MVPHLKRILVGTDPLTLSNWQAPGCLFNATVMGTEATTKVSILLPKVLTTAQ